MGTSMIKEVIERHAGADKIRKELETLKKLVSNTERLISQYEAELKYLERDLSTENQIVTTQEEIAQKNARVNLEENLKAQTSLIATINDIIAIEAADPILKELEDKKKNLIKNNEEAINKLNEEIAKLREDFISVESKNYVLRSKQKKLSKIEELINNLETSIKEKEEQLADQLKELKLRITYNYQKIETNKQRIATIKESQVEDQKRFDKEELCFMANSSQLDGKKFGGLDIEEFMFFDKKDLEETLIAREKVAALLEKRSQIESLRNETISDKNEMEARIALLEDQLSTAEKERAYIKGKVADTKETINNQAKDVMAKFIIAVDAVVNPTEEKEEANETDTTENFTAEESSKENMGSSQSFGKILSNFAETVVEEYIEEKSIIKDTVNDILDVFVKRK